MLKTFDSFFPSEESLEDQESLKEILHSARTWLLDKDARYSASEPLFCPICMGNFECNVW